MLFYKFRYFLRLLLITVCAALSSTALTSEQASEKPNEGANENNDHNSPTQQLIILLDQFTSLQADFDQYYLDDTGQHTNRLHGQMLLAKPNRFVWQTYDPLPQTIVSNGKTLWLYDPDLEQVTLRSIANDELQAPALLLSGQHQNITDNFLVSMIERPNQSVKFILEPQDKDSLYGEIWLVFVEQYLQQMVLVDVQQQALHFSFKNVMIDPVFSNSQFEFTIPPNTDIIRAN